jgi:hypothetical protein
MTTAVFEDWLNQLNETMKKKTRRIILFVDNCTYSTMYQFPNSLTETRQLKPKNVHVLALLDHYHGTSK